MNKREYFKLCILNKLYNQKKWIISILAIMREAPDDYKKDAYPYRLIQTGTSFQFLNEQNELIKIDDTEPNKPLFTLQDAIDIDSTWGSNIFENMTTTIGRVLVNFITIEPVFGSRIPFMNKPNGVGHIEKIVIPLLKDTPRSEAERNPKYFYVDEYNNYVNRLQFIEALSDITNWSATAKNIKAAPGIKEYREQLIKEYGDKLKDPAYLVEFENKLKKYDAEYLKDDPSDGIFTAGKVKNIARRKLYIDIGNEIGFSQSTEISPILTSLDEEWPTNPKDYITAMNGLRYGSFARGSETVNGGVTAKALLRSLGTFHVVDEDCGTKRGLYRKYTEDIIDRLVGHYIYLNNKWVLIENIEMAKQQLNKITMVRSPAYCISPNEQFCKYCIGEKIALNPNGLSLAATSVSSVILASFMKLMHGFVLSSSHYDFDESLT